MNIKDNWTTPWNEDRGEEMKRMIILTLIVLSCFSCAVTPQFTPLPYGIKIRPPAPDLSKNIAGFSGTWYGVWDNGRSTTLIVEKIKPPEASVIYSWGPLGTEREGGFNSYTGRIEPGKLTVTIPERGITITYLLSDDGEELKGEFRVANSINYVTMKRQPPTPPTTSSLETHTPLPIEVKIIPPSPGLPNDIAAFSGTWYGIWDGIHSTTLVIEKIDPPEVVAIYSWGKFKDIEGGWRRHIGKIELGKITVVSEKDLSITYTLSDDGEKLEGEYRRPSKSQINYVTMQRQPPTSTVTFSTEGTLTPLPVNIKIIPPISNISSNIAAFSGIWQGVWDNGRATTLVVEKIKPPEAIAIYSYGPWKKEKGGWRRYIGMIDSGRLILSNPETELIISFLLSKDGQTLEGTWQKGGGRKFKATMRRQ